MSEYLQFFILIPVAGFIISLFLPAKNEKLISWLTFATIGVHLLLAIVFIPMWMLNGSAMLNIKELILYQSPNYEFYIDFSFDKITAAYLFVGSVLTFLIVIYSSYYMHREDGYKRFFNTILFFFAGYNVLIFSGNLETLFIGWEMLGISSFLLIAFYRDRYLPVKNAVKIFSIYRIGDVGLLLAMWMSHHFWGENITFMKLTDAALVQHQLEIHATIGIFISFMILLSAIAKSAQFPFSSWLPRAMEGPTPSSAIYYGSLAVHMGVFLLLKTFPFWEHQILVRIAIGVGGLITAIISTGIARVQSSVKSQIAYSSIVQIGIMFIEMALGFTDLVLLHFISNAFLRTYQLLVSPSVVSYLIREQFFFFKKREQTIEDSLPSRIEYSLYILSLKEWNLDSIMYRYLWNPLKWIGRHMSLLNWKEALTVFIPLYGLGWLLHLKLDLLPETVYQYFPFLFSSLGLIMVLQSFTERKSARLSWVLIIMNHLWVALGISFNEYFSTAHIIIYLSGVVVSGLIGFAALKRLKNLEGSIDLDQFHGYSYIHPKIALLFLLACLGASGFPITPTFLGEDLIFTHIHENQIHLAFMVSLSFILDGLAIIRIYARVFLGPHFKSPYEISYRSS